MEAAPAYVSRFLELLKKVRRQGKGWEACCPAHDDNRASLSIAVGDEGRLLVHCHANCQPETIMAAVGLSMTDLFPPSEHGRIMRAYDYREENGEVAFQVVRMEPKDFRQRRPDGAGGWTWNLDGITVIPYRLPELIAAGTDQTIWIVEGEKDADRLAALGLVSTTNPGGAGKWRQRFGKFFAGRQVVIIPDNDDPGKKHAEQVRTELNDFVASVHILELPVGLKGDVSEWLEAGGTKEKLIGLISEVRKSHAGNGPVKGFLDPMPISEAKVSAEGSWLWHGFLSHKTITLLTALWKSGKTTLVAHLIKNMDEGGEFCGLKLSQATVLYITEEHESRWAERRNQLGLKDHIHLLVRPFKGKPRMDEWLRFMDHVEACQKKRQTDLIVFDTLSNLWPVRDENDAAGVGAALMPLHQISEKSALWLLHHNRKGDGTEATASRGSGALTAFVDTIMEFRRFDASLHSDRRRVLRSYGRYDQTVPEVVIELGDNGYVQLGEKATVRSVDLINEVYAVLPTEQPGITIADIYAGLDSTPDKRLLLKCLHAGVERGALAKTGKGVKGDPFHFWLVTGC